MQSRFTQEYERMLSYSNLVTVVYTDSVQTLKDSLRRTTAFLTLLGSPEKQISIVHVTGTSGKGSTTQLMKQVLMEAGYSVGAYVSPHITSFADRFLFNEGLHTEERLASCMKIVNDAHEEFCKQESPLSFFELSTCLALFVNARAQVDCLVLEVGLGGRYDATNVIPAPKLAIITNIDKDHTEILGSTLAKIAYEKAGIIKRNGTVICGEVRPSLKQVFTDEANKHNAALFFVPPPTALGESGKSARQLHNEAIVRRSAQELKIKPEIVEKALANQPVFAARFETVQQNPRIIVDGAHSPAKISSTVDQIKQLKEPVHILFGASYGKDIKEMLPQLFPVASRISVTRFLGQHRKATSPVELFALIPKHLRGEIYFDPHEALEAERKIAKKTPLVITGSFFLAGELREHWYPEAAIREQATLFPVR